MVGAGLPEGLETNALAANAGMASATIISIAMRNVDTLFIISTSFRLLKI
jgi:hypothetical protein